MNSSRSELYDSHYFENYCGERYSRSVKWLTFFGNIADRIIHDFKPDRVLDVGCGMGLLVECLRDRGVNAFGIDVSDYAMGQVRTDIQAYCQLSSALEPFKEVFDLIVCIEVLEHLYDPEGQLAIRNLCSATNNILFSSTPNDYSEATHFNIQPLDYWVGRFGSEGFARDINYDATFIAPWALMFKRSTEPLHHVASTYERKLWQLNQENYALRSTLLDLRSTLKDKEAVVKSKPEQTQVTKTIQVLVLSHDTVSTRMAGPGLRYYHLAEMLSHRFQTVLAVPNSSPSSVQGFTSPNLKIVQYDRRRWNSIQSLALAANVIVLPASGTLDFPDIVDCNAALVVDAYDPIVSERLAMLQPDQNVHRMQAQWLKGIQIFNQRYRVGDFFMCASERQRDWLLGLLEANGRINPYTYGEDPSFRQLVDVVPFGLSKVPPVHTQAVVKGVWAGIAKTDKVILWGGGLWSWLDPLTAIKATAKALQIRDDIRLIFPGTKHPNPLMANMTSLVADAKQLANALGLAGKYVFFEDWIPIASWPDVLIESDVALTLHSAPTLESHLAFRSRVLDYIWAGIPIIATKGDVTSDLIEKFGMGVVVDYSNVNQVADALIYLLENPLADSGFAAARELFTWERVAAPLINFCALPHRAPDYNAIATLRA